MKKQLRPRVHHPRSDRTPAAVLSRARRRPATAAVAPPAAASCSRLLGGVRAQNRARTSGRVRYRQNQIAGADAARRKRLPKTLTPTGGGGGGVSPRA
jgi:hypothetical protein